MTASPPNPGFPRHGGDLAAAAARWGQPPAGWLDLSTGINPHPYPLPALAAEAWTRLPDAAEERALRQAAARRYRAAKAEFVLAAPGTSALIQALPRTRPSAEVVILGPTYGEHAAAWTIAGHRVRSAGALEAIGDALQVVVVNPNNPDGRLVPPADLLALAARLTAKGGMLVVDEAFADEIAGASLLPQLAELPEGLVVLRSFGKFYGLAGMRLGFAVAAPALVAALAAQFGPWAVAGPALAIGRQALEDDAWAEATGSRLRAAAARLDGLLTAAGLTVLGGTPLFRLAQHAEAHALWHRLGVAGILVRAFPDRPTLLRFGLPADEAGWERLGRVFPYSSAASTRAS